MSPQLDRRSMLQLLAAAPLAAGFAWTDAEASTAGELAQAAQAAAKAGAAYAPKFFTAHEWDTVRMLVDIIIPKDELSSASAWCPEFMDSPIDEPKMPEESAGGKHVDARRAGVA
jgi:gluconate 2-dehydrogenase gamma chain